MNYNSNDKSDYEKCTVIIDIVWKMEKDRLHPFIQIEPVIINSTKIEYVTGFNKKFILENKLGKGAIVTVARRGDIIPYISGVIKNTEEILCENVVLEPCAKLKFCASDVITI